MKLLLIAQTCRLPIVLVLGANTRIYEQISPITRLACPPKKGQSSALELVGANFFNNRILEGVGVGRLTTDDSELQQCRSRRIDSEGGGG